VEEYLRCPAVHYFIYNYWWRKTSGARCALFQAQLLVEEYLRCPVVHYFRHNYWWRNTLGALLCIISGTITGWGRPQVPCCALFQTQTDAGAEPQVR
jgi:hypothetical protein